MNALATGALIGLALGIGLICLLLGLPLLRRPGLDERLAPYVRDVAPASRLLRSSSGGGPALLRLLLPVARDLGSSAERLLGGTASVRRRLDRAGLPVDVDGFRAEQLLWAAGGTVAGGLVAAVTWWQRPGAAVPLAVLVLVAGAVGMAGRDWYLTQQVERRERRILAEFPAVAEMLALAVGAGEGPTGALERVSRMSDGELAVELRRTLADARAGASLVEALQRLGARTGLAPLARFVDGVVIAIERGTPLADVLRAQAQDVREAGRRALLETAGRKEIAMMLPVVFGVLPVTVLFAVYPGFAFLRLGL